jgi:hypothetical protein
MEILTLLSDAKSAGLHVCTDGDRLHISGPKRAADVAERLGAHKAEIIAHLTRRREPIGQTIEDFCRETWPDAEDQEPTTWRALPITDKQRETLLKGNVFDIPATRGEASDKIKELIESGAFCDFLSLAELESFDHRAPNRSRRRRFCCPLCGTSKDLDATHRSMSLDTATGAYFCFRCDAKGKLREYCDFSGSETRIFIQTPAVKESADDKWKQRLAFARPIRGTDGADYLERRGVPVDVAENAGVKFGTWWRPPVKDGGKPEPFAAVIFPVRDRAGNLVAAQARAIVGADKLSKGQKSLGVFFTTPGRSPRLAITEAPIDALVLAACGLPAIALLGTTWPVWLLAALSGRSIALATDADDAGDKCARELGALIASWRLRPTGAKDWAEIAATRGLDAVRIQIEAAEKNVHAFTGTKNAVNAPKAKKGKDLSTERSRVHAATQDAERESVDRVGTRERSAPKASATNGLIAFPVKNVPVNAGTLDTPQEEWSDEWQPPF